MLSFGFWLKVYAPPFRPRGCFFGVKSTFVVGYYDCGWTENPDPAVCQCSQYWTRVSALQAFAEGPADRFITSVKYHPVVHKEQVHLDYLIEMSSQSR